MNLYLIENIVNGGYDVFDSAVVVAKSHKDARNIHPGNENAKYVIDPKSTGPEYWSLSDWCKPEEVEVKCIGKAFPKMKRGVVCHKYTGG